MSGLRALRCPLPRAGGDEATQAMALRRGAFLRRYALEGIG